MDPTGLVRIVCRAGACFLNRFAARDRYANCDRSTLAPVLSVLDFSCFSCRFSAERHQGRSSAWGDGYARSSQGQPAAYLLRKQVKSLTLRSGGAVEASQLA